MFCLLKVGKWGGKVGRLMRVLWGSGEEGPHDHSMIRQVSSGTKEGHTLGMSKQFGRRRNPLAGWRKLCGWVMQLCSMRLFSAEFLLLTTLESGWGGALGSACRTVSLCLRSPDQFQCYRHRERAATEKWILSQVHPFWKQFDMLDSFTCLLSFWKLPRRQEVGKVSSCCLWS